MIALEDIRLKCQHYFPLTIVRKVKNKAHDNIDLFWRKWLQKMLLDKVNLMWKKELL